MAGVGLLLTSVHHRMFAGAVHIFLPLSLSLKYHAITISVGNTIIYLPTSGTKAKPIVPKIYVRLINLSLSLLSSLFYGT